jgi:hypothetical protein
MVSRIPAWRIPAWRIPVLCISLVMMHMVLHTVMLSVGVCTPYSLYPLGRMVVYTMCTLLHPLGTVYYGVHHGCILCILCSEVCMICIMRMC